MDLWKKKNKIIVTCPKGVTPYLAEEITVLGFPNLSELDTAVQTEGTLEDTMILNLHLRTAQRVLYLLDRLPAATPDLLYSGVNKIPWETIVAASGREAYICVTSIAENPQVSDSRFVNLKVKDAIVDRIRDKCGFRPDSGPDKNRAVAHVYWKNNQAAIYIDTSGERLAMRGYRRIPLQAPLQETLAASIVAASGWRDSGAFVNPMCGSGTIAIEAAMLTACRAPGLLRNNYGFMHVSGFPAELWKELRRNARNSAVKKPPAKIIATDIDGKAIYAAQNNARTAGVDHLIEFSVRPYEKTPLPEGGGVIILNPPYGERMEAAIPVNPSAGKQTFSADRKVVLRRTPERFNRSKASRLASIYAGIGDFLKKAGDGYRGYVFTGNLEMAKKIGLRTSRRIILYNGDIECRLLEYDLYKGSRKNPGT